MPTTQITLPYKFKPRDYQVPLWKQFHAPERKNICIIWHRRGGKDINCWNYAIQETHDNKQSTKYGFPTSEMARDNLWEAYTNEGMNFTDYAPMELRERRNIGDDGLNDTFKEIKFKHGGALRVISTHKPSTLRGGNDKLYVLSELQKMDPQVIDIIEPVVEANKGRIVVNLTADGDSAAKGLVEAWKSDPRWWVQVLTADDTPVFTTEQLARIKSGLIQRYIARGLSEEEAVAFFEQEYFCSFESPVIGSYFGSAMRRAQDQGRITRVMFDPKLPVNTAWDLGIDDSMTIWFFQLFGNEVRLIDYYESSGEGIPYYIRVMKGQQEGYERMKDYTYGQHYAPHDIEVRELTTGVSRKDTAASLGISFTTVQRPTRKEDGIEATRNILSRCWFDSENTKRGINALKGYRKKWNDKLLVYEGTPVHDWTSHGSDGMQTLALANPQPSTKTFQQPNRQYQFKG